MSLSLTPISPLPHDDKLLVNTLDLEIPGKTGIVMSGRVGDLTPKQVEALAQLKEKAKDVLLPQHDDHFILKWLRARSFDVKKAEKMMRESIEWRKKYDADNLLDWTPPEVLVKYYPGGLCGVDKEGYPFWIDTLGTADIKGLMFSARKAEVIKYKAYWTEKIYKVCEEQSAKLGKHIDQIGLIFDMEGIGMAHLWKPAVDAFIEMLIMFEANYPETLRYCIVINAPKIFPIAWNLVKPFLSEDTKTKIFIEKGDWKKKVLERIDASELPVHWGGTRTDPDGDPYCKSKICMGGKVPESYNVAKTNFVDMDNFTTGTVGRGSSLQINYDVNVANSILRWQFMTDDNDIGFGVFKKTAEERQNKGDMEEVVPTDRVNSHMVPEDGSVICKEPGTYVIRFDNTYSWVRSKKVQYLLEALPPDVAITEF